MKKILVILFLIPVFTLAEPNSVSFGEFPQKYIEEWLGISTVRYVVDAPGKDIYVVIERKINGKVVKKKYVNGAFPKDSIKYVDLIYTEMTGLETPEPIKLICSIEVPGHGRIGAVMRFFAEKDWGGLRLSPDLSNNKPFLIMGKDVNNILDKTMTNDDYDTAKAWLAVKDGIAIWIELEEQE